MFSVLASLSLVAPSIVCVPEARTQELDRERVAQIVRVVGREAVSQEGVPGIAIAVAREGEIVAQGAFGATGVELEQTLDDHTRFALGSLTRQFTAGAVLQLVAKKKIGLDDPLTKHLPGFPTEQGVPTIRQLLASRSGVPGWERIVAKHPEVAERELDEAGFLALFKDIPFEFAPGSGFSLDTAGYALLSLAVQKVVDRPFSEWIAGEVIETAGLAETTFCPAGDRPIGFASDCKHITDVRELEVPMPGAPRASTQSLCATAADVARWQEALFNGTVLDTASLRLFLAPSGSAKEPDEYGCAIGTSRLETFVRHAHSGGVGGFRVIAAYYPASRIAVVVLTNCATAEVDRIEREIARVAHGLPATDREAPLRPEEEKRLTGAYQLATTRVQILARDGHLWFEEPGQEAIHLRSRGRGDFVVEGQHDTRVVFDLEGEKAAWFTLIRSGTTSRAVRMD